MRFGVDIHNTIDAKPKFFTTFTKRLIEQGHNVYIITGSQRTPEIESQLKEFGIQYTHFYSIADDLLSQGKEVYWKTPNDPFFKNEDWNYAKAKYCKQQNIDLMIDDSIEYGKYFKTLYMRVI